MAESLVGVGFAFPMRLDPAGAIALVAREHKIEQSIRLILATAQGERPMRPDFGSGVHNYVFSSDDAVTAGRLAYEVRAALERWEPRIDLVDVVGGRRGGARRRLPADRDPLRHPGHERPAQPRVSRST